MSGMQKESVREVNGRSSNDRSSRAPEDRNSGRGYDDRSRGRDDRDSSGRGYNDRSSRGPEDRSSGPYDRSGRDPYGSGASNDRDGRKFGGGDSRGGYDDRGRGDLTREEGGGGNVAVVQVPDVCAGHLIGKLGSKMKEIQAKYNIMLQIPSTFDPGTGMRSVTITDHGGGQVAACVKEIHGVIAMALQLDRSQKEIAVTPSIAIDGSNILLTNPFAVALDFYEKYRHFRLTEEDLMKIFTTFAKKSEKLLPGLSKKYKLPVAKSITMNRLARLLALYPVPQPYRDTILKNLKEKLPATIDIDSLLRYDLTEDIYSITFDAANCIQKGRIIAADTTIKPLDNISKVRLMLQNNNEKLSTDRSIISRAKDVMKKKKQEHYFDLIVESSVKMKKVKPGLDTPLMLLKKFMNDRKRVHVVIRRKAGVKAILLGYVQAFDKHMNILLSDVDETYVSNKLRGKVCVNELRTKQIRGNAFKPNPSNKHILTKYSDQLLIRGDNIVMVSSE